MVRIYLQYCIFVWNDKSSTLNNRLIDSYTTFIENSKQTNTDYKQLELIRNANVGLINACSSNYKQMLIYFLNETKNYEPMYALSQLDLDNYPEERAIVLGKLGKNSSYYLKSIILSEIQGLTLKCLQILNLIIFLIFLQC